MGIMTQTIGQDICPPDTCRAKVHTIPIVKAFESFHLANPDVYAAFRRLAMIKAARGATRIGLSQILEVVRWEMDLHPESDGTARISDNQKTFYARLAMLDEATLSGLFHLRGAPAADLWIHHQINYRAEQNGRLL